MTTKDATVAAADQHPRVFISYARKDSTPLAEELVGLLTLAGFESYLDTHDIAKAEDWEARLGALILKADTVVFIISPASIASPRCQWEVDRTVALSKRIIPVEWTHVPEAEVPVALKRLNYTIFRQGQPFARPMAELAAALRQDVDWIREHTRLGEAASRWQAGGKPDEQLLRGRQIAETQAWMQRRKEGAPEMTEAQRAYLAASEAREADRLGEERTRLAERERLVKEAEKAARRAHKVQRRSYVVLTVLLLAVLTGIAGGLWGVYTGWKEVMINRAQFIASQMDQQVAENHPVEAMLLGLDALPDQTSGRPKDRAVRWESAAQVSLDGAWRKWGSGWGERRHLAGHEGFVDAVAFSPDGKLVLTGSWDNTARLWEAATGKPLSVFIGHGNAVKAVAFSPDGKWVLTGSDDNTARLWEAATGKPLSTLTGHEDGVGAVAFSPDGKLVATGTGSNFLHPVHGDMTARLWEAATGRLAVTLLGHTDEVLAVAFSPDSKLVLTGSKDKTARLWEAATGKILAVFSGHEGPVSAVRFARRQVGTDCLVRQDSEVVGGGYRHAAGDPLRPRG